MAGSGRWDESLKLVGGGIGGRLGPKIGGIEVETPATPLVVYFFAFTMPCMSDFPPERVSTRS